MEARQRQQDTLNARNNEQEEPHREQEETNDRNNPDAADSGPTQNIDGGIMNLPDNDHPAMTDDRETADFSYASNQNYGPSSTESIPEAAKMHDELEQKLPASTANRGKRVRIVTPGLGIDPADSTFDRPAFPAFYRVIQDAGASVYNDGQAVSFIMRVVPFGVVVLGKEIAWRNCDGENRLMVRIPDGWVIDEDVERIVAVPFEP
jgi:hypothetical protein